MGQESKACNVLKFPNKLTFSEPLQLSRITVNQFSLQKTVVKVSPILVTLMSCNDSDFESSNVNLKENKPNGINPNSNDINYYILKNEGKFLWFSAD